ncbi:hypothetical protein HJG60_009055 [Phyllostomus discolor]|nr:hypothetical protein HJG60_009055 [Phyllostomus discolor]
MEKLGLSCDDEGGNQQAAAAPSPGDLHRLSILRCIQWLAHACRCRRAGCALAPCQKLKRVVQHTKGCKWKTSGGCPVCKQLIALCCYHAKLCQEHACPVLLCPHIKQRLRQAQTLGRRTASGPQRAGVVGQQPGPSSPTPAAPAPAQAAGPQFPGLPPAAVEAAVHGQGAVHVHQEPQPQMAHVQTFQRPMQLQVPQMTPMAPLGMNPPAMARGPGGHLEPRMGSAGIQQRPPWAQGGLPQPQQQQAGMAGPAGTAVARHGQPWSTAPEPGLGQVTAPHLKPGSVSPQTLRNLLRTLRSPSSPLQQRQVLSALLANPQLSAILVRQRAAKYGNPNRHPLAGQPGMLQSQLGLQPPALPGQQGVHANPATPNRKPMQMGVQRAGLPQQQPQQLLQLLQLPMAGMSPQAQQMNVDHDTMASQFRGTQRRQQMGNGSWFQPSRAVGYPALQQQQHPMQQVLPGSLAQQGQRPQAWGAAEAEASLQAYQQRLLQQQMGSPAQPNPLSPQQRLLPNWAQSPHLQGQQTSSFLSSEMHSPQPVPSLWLQSWSPNSTPSPRRQPQPSLQHISPQTGSPHLGLVAAQANPMQ